MKLLHKSLAVAFVIITLFGMASFPLPVSGAAIQASGSTPTPALTSASTFHIGKSATPLREGPGTAWRVVASLQPNEPLTISGISPDQLWALASTQTQLTGWIAIKALAENPLLVQPPFPQVTPSLLPPPAILNWKGDPVGSLCVNVSTEFYGNYVLNTYADPNAHILGIPDLPTFEGNPTAVPTVDVFSEAGGILTHFVNIPADASKCDAALTITINIDQLYTQYKEHNTGEVQHCFDGVTVDGTFTLESGKNKLSAASKHTRTPQKTLTSCPSSTTYEKETNWVLADGLRKLWGDAVLPYLFASPIDGMPEAAVDAAAAGGKKSLPYVPALIDLLDRRVDLQEPITAALEKITGQKLGNDPQAWKDWWKGYQPNAQPSLTGQQKPYQQLTPQALPIPSPINKYSSAPGADLVIAGKADPKIDQTDVKLVSILGYHVANQDPTGTIPSSGFQMVGEVENTSTAPIQTVQIAYQLLNNGKAVVEQGTLNTRLNTIQPGEKAGFIYFFFDLQGIADIRITKITFKPVKGDLPQVSLSAHKEQVDGKYVTLTGSAKNDSQSLIKGMNVVASFYDANGILVNLESTETDSLYSGFGPLEPGDVDRFNMNVVTTIPYQKITHQVEAVIQ
jgi:hypothetical protein